MEGCEIDHHKRYEYCQTRLKYRRSKELTAVKAYTIANESRHLLVFGVPKINLQAEVKRCLERNGSIKSITLITDTIVKESAVNLEPFSDVYHVEFEKIQAARHAKKRMDARNFYGGILHISYATEYETSDDVVKKLEQRKREVVYRQQLEEGKQPQKRHANLDLNESIPTKLTVNSNCKGT